MSLIYITGPTGAGKTTVKENLASRGYAAYDTDGDKIADHFDIVSEKIIEYPSDPRERTDQWHKNHVFNLVPEKMDLLARSAKDKLVFLCGAASNDTEFLDYFDTVICLNVDRNAVAKRILNRSTNNYGRSKDELEVILARHDDIVEKYHNAGTYFIDTTDLSIDKLTDKILRYCKKLPA